MACCADCAAASWLGIGCRSHAVAASVMAAMPTTISPEATATPLAKAAARIMMGATVAGLRAEGLLPAALQGPCIT